MLPAKFACGPLTLVVTGRGSPGDFDESRVATLEDKSGKVVATGPVYTQAAGFVSLTHEGRLYEARLVSTENGRPRALLENHPRHRVKWGKLATHWEARVVDSFSMLSAA